MDRNVLLYHEISGEYIPFGVDKVSDTITEFLLIQVVSNDTLNEVTDCGLLIMINSIYRHEGKLMALRIISDVEYDKIISFDLFKTIKFSETISYVSNTNTGDRPQITQR